MILVEGSEFPVPLIVKINKALFAEFDYVTLISHENLDGVVMGLIRTNIVFVTWVQDEEAIRLRDLKVQG